MRAAGRKALKPQPTHQAKLLARHLTFRVPLHFAAIPETDISSTCERFGISLETRRRQERAFGLLRKVYAKRAALRGQQPPPFPEWPQPFQNWPSDDNTEEYSYWQNRVPLGARLAEVRSGVTTQSLSPPIRRDLNELLVSNELARIYGTRTPLPDGRDSREYLAHLTRAGGRGEAWRLGQRATMTARPDRF